MSSNVAIPVRTRGEDTPDSSLAGNFAKSLTSIMSSFTDGSYLVGSSRGHTGILHSSVMQHPVAASPPQSVLTASQDGGLFSASGAPDGTAEAARSGAEVRGSLSTLLRRQGSQAECPEQRLPALDSSTEQLQTLLHHEPVLELEPQPNRWQFTGGNHGDLSRRLSIERRFSQDPLAAPLLGERATTSGRLPDDADAGDDAAKGGRKPAMQEFCDAIVIGAINTIVALPVTLAFIAIIFRSPRFNPYTSALAKLAFFGSAVHQLVFSLRSSLPFAIGQIQDVGLIFLSAMSSAIVQRLDAVGEHSDTVLLTTSLLAITLSTACVGILLIVVGKQKLAGLIAYMPLPVVAGYLGYIGYFCIAAGAGQATGQPIASLPSWLLLLHHDALPKTAAALASFVVIFAMLRFWSHPLSMPCALCVVPLLYYVVVGCAAAYLGWGWGEMRLWLADHGWIMIPPPGAGHEQFYEVYKMYDFGAMSGAAWMTLLRQVPTMLALFFVVAFGSCLDITAIQASLPYEVDYNRELATVGWSNLVTGALGAGFTGSYIFSQTVFTLRNKCTTRVHGVVLIAAELLLFLVPMSFNEYLPNFYYGALMIVFGVEIAADWLFFSFVKFMRTEFLLTWINFGCIMLCTAYLPVSGLEVGIVVGVLVCAIHFAVDYSKVQMKATTLVSSRSNCVRPFLQRATLELFRGNTLAVSLSGYIFFGSSVIISERVKELARLLVDRPAGPHQATQPFVLPPSSLEADARSKSLRPERIPEAIARAKRFMLLDFRHVTGLDATAASLLKTLYLSLSQKRIMLVLTGIEGSSQVYGLLRGNGVVAVDGDWEADGCCPCFETMEHALSWCEQHFLEVAEDCKLLPPQVDRMELFEVLDMHLSLPSSSGGPLFPGVSRKQAAEDMMAFLELRSAQSGDTVFEIGDTPEALFIILSGEVTCEIDYAALSRSSQAFTEDTCRQHAIMTTGKMRYLQYAAGGVTGDLEFFLQRCRTFRARCTADAHMLALTQAAYQRMVRDAPHLLVLLQHIILRNEMLSSSNALELLERARAT